MKKLILFILAASLAAVAQQSDISYRGTLNATCSNASTSCSNAIGQPLPNQTSGSAIEVATRGYGVATVTVSGSYTGVTINFEFSDDGGATYYSDTCTRTDQPIQEINETLPSNQTRSWDCGVAGSTSFRVRQSANSTGAPAVGITLTSAPIEPAPTVAIQGLKYTAITTSTNTQISAIGAYLHTITIVNPGATSPSITIVDTSAANCSGGTTIATIPTAQLTAAMAPVSLTFDLATTNGLCITTAGATPAPALVVTWR